eukprot:CAMPEP_0197641026 /NCGR_PEP_ID=MMETSP1338-20131121/15108_1 /TAXON_ID=43686 ORGANISM="Pelagodinium beii, Strain RCC1491" /NCGR_SAMPLE_ID=MMETSP1338 /ASSEMBLY_ACC=CAM_ASM_000754 /LENGTH=375 /DNA_ID=CAMNT_0043213925 /DNA_START=70 /DNA_END=1194 /DNA_ORIENTATION=+
MSSFFYISIFAYVSIGGIGVSVFLWGKENGNSIFDKLYRLFCMQFPQLLKKALEKCCGKRAPAVLDAIWTYVCYTSNPLVQIFYLLVVVGGYATFVAYGYPHLTDNKLLSNVHKYAGFLIFTICLWVWWKACSTDPGTVTPANVEDLCEIFEWDDQIFSKTYCSTCDLVKPARSKHCSLCKRCIVRFDHHCIWINNCVGLGNHKYFLGFLFMHLVICFYGFGLGSTILYNVAVQKELFSAVFVNPVTRERYQATNLIVLQFLLATEGMIVFVVLLSGIMGFVLFGFFGWHLNLVRTGCTTNEISKWNFLKWVLKQEGDEGKAKIKDLKNGYNEGFIANFREVLYPMDVSTLSRSSASDATEGTKRQSGKKDGKAK